MNCSYIGCNRIATWFLEYSTPFHVRSLDEVNVVPWARMPLCHVHKTPGALPYDTLEIRDSDHICPVVVKPDDYKACKHAQVMVDPELRTVRCGKCDTQLDPISVLIGYARELTMKNYKIHAFTEFQRKAKLKNERRVKKLNGL